MGHGTAMYGAGPSPVFQDRTAEEAQEDLDKARTGQDPEASQIEAPEAREQLAQEGVDPKRLTPDQAESVERQRTLNEIADQGVVETTARTAAATIPTGIPGVDIGVERPGSEFTQDSREQVRAVRREAEVGGGRGGPLETAAKAASELAVGSEREAQIDAAINAALLPVGGPVAGSALKGAAKGGGQIAAREGAEEASERGLRELAETVAGRGGRGSSRPGRETAQELAESGPGTASRRNAGSPSRASGIQGAAGRGGREAGEEASEEGGRLLGRTRDRLGSAAEAADEAIGRVGFGKAAGAALGGSVIAGAGYDVATKEDVFGSFGSDDQAGGQSDGGDVDDSYLDEALTEDSTQNGDRPPSGYEPGSGPRRGGPGSGPFEPTGAGPLSLGFLDRIGGGLGAALDQVGGGIADTLRALGIPIGEAAGKAIAVGGTLILIAYAVKTGVGPFASLDGGSSASSSSGLPSGVTRGPNGQFTSGG